MKGEKSAFLPFMNLITEHFMETGLEVALQTRFALVLIVGHIVCDGRVK